MVNWVTNRPECRKMNASSVVLALFFLTSLKANDALDKARELEKSGDVSGARAALAAAAQHSPGDVDALTDYAEFLVRYGDPDSRAAYTKTFDAIEKSGDRARLAAVARELTILD
jgi:thioredoxin-like negative regulator of GroEL